MSIAAGPTAARAEKTALALKDATEALIVAQQKLNQAALLASGDYKDNAQRPADLAAALRIVAGQVAVERNTWDDYADNRKRASAREDSA